MRICHKCMNEVSSNRTLLKLKDGFWYCLTCIMYYKKTLFSQLKVDGYWYNILHPFLYSSYSENINYKTSMELMSRK